MPILVQKLDFAPFNRGLEGQCKYLHLQYPAAARPILFLFPHSVQGLSFLLHMSGLLQNPIFQSKLRL